MKAFVVAVIAVLGLMLPAPAGAAAPRGGPAAVSPCTSSMVQVSASWQKKNTQMLGGGAVNGAVVFTPVGGARCTLTGWPKLRLYDAGGKRLQVQQRNLAGTASPPRSVTLRITTQTRKAATAQVTWMNWCKGAVPAPLSLRVRLPGASNFQTVAIRPGAKAVASCVNPTASSVLDVRPFVASTG